MRNLDEKHWKEVYLLDIAPIVAKLVDPRKEKYRQMILIAPDHIESGCGRVIDKVTAADQAAISGKFLVKKNSVIYSKIRPYLMKAAIAYEDALCSADMYPLECTNQVLPKYLLAILMSDKFTSFTKSCSNRTGIPKVNRTELADFKLVLPPIPEQRAIADMLSAWDLAIEKTDRLITAAKSRIMRLSANLLFGKRSSEKDTLKRNKWFSVPDHWKIVKLGSVAKEAKVTNVAGDNIRVLSCTKYDGLVDSLTYFDKQIFSKDTSAYKVVSKGQFAYATNHIEEGSIGYQCMYDKGLVSPMYTVFKTDKSIDDGYLYKVLKSVTYLHIFRVNTSASVARRGSLRWNEFAKLPIPLPPLEEQIEISAALDTAQLEIDLLKKQAEAYRKQKRGLMQKLLTGEWRVRVA